MSETATSVSRASTAKTPLPGGRAASEDAVLCGADSGSLPWAGIEASLRGSGHPSSARRRPDAQPNSAMGRRAEDRHAPARPQYSHKLAALLHEPHLSTQTVQTFASQATEKFQNRSSPLPAWHG